jgi:hypothetical protein
MTPDEELAARLHHARATAKSLRNHLNTAVAVFAELDEWATELLDQLEPIAKEAQGHARANGARADIR